VIGVNLQSRIRPRRAETGFSFYKCNGLILVDSRSGLIIKISSRQTLKIPRGDSRPRLSRRAGSPLLHAEAQVGAQSPQGTESGWRLKNLAERVGFESATKRTFNNMQERDGSFGQGKQC